jgi:hypothetical protein
MSKSVGVALFEIGHGEVARAAEAFRGPLIQVGDQADTVTSLHILRRSSNHSRRARRRRMTPADTSAHGKDVGQ